MNWQENSSVKLSGRNFTIWESKENALRYWAVTEDRDGRGVVPSNDLTHVLSKRAALSNLREQLAREAGSR